ncbi:formate dehydrogenase subunit gamma [Sphaerotilus sp.]|uniref:formate dehydrogenase subunit gamma n=1 Tax=Sphaerotilus sp. TaxID=2093942 RepID=UPI0034E2E04B
MIRHLGALLLAAALLATSTAGAQTGDAASAPAMSGAPAGFVTPAEPHPDDTAAERRKSQPGNNAPVWRTARATGTQPGYASLPGAEKGVLIQSLTQYPGARLSTAGEAWRQARNQWIIPYGGSLLLIVGLAIALFHWHQGALGGHTPDTGRMVERFTPLERSAHWLNAIAFVVLAVSGLVMAFGKFVLLPVMGHTLFGWLTFALKNAHNFAGPLFAVSLLIVIVTFARDNLPRSGDLAWLRTGGGLLGGHEVPSHRYNAGEKLVFWGGVFVLGLVVVASGLVLDKVVPGFGSLRSDMQIANMVHGTATVLMMTLFMGHIYIGTIGMKGAYDGMRTGYVDEGWAQEHHALWYADIQAGKIPAQRSTPIASSVAPSSNASRPA